MNTVKVVKEQNLKNFEIVIKNSENNKTLFFSLKFQGDSMNFYIKKLSLGRYLTKIPIVI